MSDAKPELEVDVPRKDGTNLGAVEYAMISDDDPTNFILAHGDYTSVRPRISAAEWDKISQWVKDGHQFVMVVANGLFITIQTEEAAKKRNSLLWSDRKITGGTIEISLTYDDKPDNIKGE